MKLLIIRNDLGEELVLTSLDKPIFFFQGAFSPPHIGHWIQLERIFLKFPNAKIIVNQLGDRHGFSTKIIKYVFSQYIHQSLYQYKILLVYQKSIKTILQHSFLRDATHFIFLRGFESQKHFPIEQCTTFHIATKIQKKLSAQKIKVILYFTNRSPPNSTQFTKLLTSSIHTQECQEYIPNHIHNKIHILQLLKKDLDALKN